MKKKSFVDQDNFTRSKLKKATSNFDNQLKSGRVNIQRNPMLSTGILMEARNIKPSRLFRGR